jgi:hypothetical protein
MIRSRTGLIIAISTTMTLWFAWAILMLALTH